MLSKLRDWLTAVDSNSVSYPQRDLIAETIARLCPAVRGAFTPPRRPPTKSGP